MLSTKSKYECPSCKDTTTRGANQDAPVCQKCRVTMKLIKPGVMTK